MLNTYKMSSDKIKRRRIKRRQTTSTPKSKRRKTTKTKRRKTTTKSKRRKKTTKSKRHKTTSTSKSKRRKTTTKSKRRSKLKGGSKTICSTCKIFSSNKYGEYCCKTCRDTNGKYHGKSILKGAIEPHPNIHNSIIPDYINCCKKCGVFNRLKNKDKCCMSCDGTIHGKSITPFGTSEHPQKCDLKEKQKNKSIATLTEWVFAKKYRPLTKDEVKHSIQKDYEDLLNFNKTKLKSLFFPIKDIAKVNNITKKEFVDTLKEKRSSGSLFSWNGDETEIRFANSNNDYLFPENYPLDKWIRKYLQKVAMKNL